MRLQSVGYLQSDAGPGILPINQPRALYQKAPCRNRIDDALVAGAPAYGLDNAVNGAPVEFVRSEGAFNVIVRSFERVDAVSMFR